MKPIGIDPPPSRRVVDRYGFWGIIYGIFLLMGMLIVLAAVGLWHLSVSAWNLVTHKETPR